MKPTETLAVIGHSLAAEENRLPFQILDHFQTRLLIPRRWAAHSTSHVYSAKHPTHTNAPPLEWLDVRLSGRNSLFSWKGLSRRLRENPPQIIYCWEEPWTLATAQVARTARTLNIPWLFYAAENRPKPLPPPFRWLQQRAFSSAAGAIAITEAATMRLRDAGFRGPIHSVPLWIRPLPPLEPNPSSRRLAYVGRLIPLKRVDLVIEALRYLPGYSLDILGDGPARPGLEAQAQSEGLKGRVRFHGRIENRQIHSKLYGCSLAVLPTDQTPRQAEQFGKAAIEAISGGLPVLTSDTGHYLEFAQTFPALRTARISSAHSMATAIEAFLATYPTAAELAASSLMARNRFGVDAVAHLFENAFGSALQTHSQGKA